MNIKRHAERLETYLEDELKKELPIAILPDGSIGYKGFSIKQNKDGLWVLKRITGYEIDKFCLKACALLAARYYNIDAFAKYTEIKILDTEYQHNAIDAGMFKQRYNTVKDIDRKDLYLWRWEITEHRAKRAKQNIVSKFKAVF